MVNNIKSIWYIAKIEYVKWITNPRIIIVGVMLLFMKSLAIDPLLDRAVKMGDRLNVFEPFIAITNSGMLILIIPCIFLILLSDYPNISRNTLFVKRIGKKRWFLGQQIFVVLAIGTYISILLATGMIMSKGTMDVEWSQTIRLYESVYPDEIGNYTSNLIPSNLYNQIDISTALVEAIVFNFMYMYIIVLILYLFRIWMLSNNMGLLAVFFIIGMGVTTCTVKSNIMWMFPMANAIPWLHYDEILSRTVYPIYLSVCYFIGLIMILVLFNLISLKKMQFINMGD